MTLAAGLLLAALSTADAIATLLNSASATSPERFAAAREQIEADARAGKPLQQFVIGVTTSDKALAAKYVEASRERIYQLASAKDNAMAWYLLSMESNNFRQLKHAADLGNVQAMNALGTIAIQEALRSETRTTNSVMSILRQSYRYFSRAAEKRDANAFINLGTCHLRGLGCEQNYLLAYRCFKAAADMGHPEGMDYVSACYENGHGIRKDLEASLYWRMRARAARGDKAADTWLRAKK